MPSVGIGIRKQTGTNTVQVISGIKAVVLPMGKIVREGLRRDRPARYHACTGGAHMLKDILYEKAEQQLVEKELNPDKSRRLADWTSADHSGSLRNDTETLYLNEQGDYYLVYEGGLTSGFHDLPGVESWFGGRYVRSITVEEAYAWCLETGNTDVARDHFPFFLISVSDAGNRG